jgi:chitin disaccharide deacetylase
MPQITYVSTYMGFSNAFPEWQALVKRLAAEYKLHLVGGDPEIRSLGNVWNAGRDVPFEAGDVRSEKLARRLEALEAGNWRMIDHAAVDDPEMRAITHPGYEDVAADRGAVRQAWSSLRVLEVVRRRKIKLVGYR